MGSSANCADYQRPALVVRGQIIAGAGREVRGQLFGVWCREGGGGVRRAANIDDCRSLQQCTLTDGVLFFRYGILSPTCQNTEDDCGNHQMDYKNKYLIVRENLNNCF